MSKPKRCGKRRFPSRRAAADALLEMPARPSEGVYRCWKRGCGGAWHVSSHVGEADPRGRRK